MRRDPENEVEPQDDTRMRSAALTSSAYVCSFLIHCHRNKHENSIGLANVFLFNRYYNRWRLNFFPTQNSVSKFSRSKEGVTPATHRVVMPLEIYLYSFAYRLSLSRRRDGSLVHCCTAKRFNNILVSTSSSVLNQEQSIIVLLRIWLDDNSFFPSIFDSESTSLLTRAVPSAIPSTRLSG